LINGKWIEPKKEYYISITTGYNWIEPSKESIDEVYDTLNIILPNKEVRDFYLTVCASGLFGDVLQNLILALGRGRNGKGCINELIKLSLGNYAYLLNSAILTQPIKDGLNADVANMNNKRLVITREPPSNAYVNNTTLRSITGGGNITCRGLYEDGKSSKEFKNTTIMETNDFLKFKTKIELADKERLIIVPFKTQFVKIIEDVDESNHYYLGNDKYTSNEWRKQNKYAMMKILLDYSKIFLQNDRNIKKSMPEIIKNTTYKYLERADFIVKWITETIQPSKDKNSYVCINELWNEHFKNSETYMSLSKAQKREEGSKKGFINYIETSLFFSKYYHERKNIGGTYKRNILLGFEYIPEEKEETKCKIPDETDSNSDSE
jgi:phage/plasmid-associated DNA primase